MSADATEQESQATAPTPSALEPTDATAEPLTDGLNAAESAPSGERERLDKPDKSPIKGIEDAVRAAYTSRARLLEISAAVLKGLPIAESASDSQVALARELANGDRTMAGTFRILQLAASKGVDLKKPELGLAPVLNRLVDLAEVAMTSHPLFRPWADQLVDPKAEPRLTTELVHQLAREVTGANFGLDEDAVSKADRLRLQSNAVACFALFRVLRGPWSLDDFVDAMREGAWVHHAPLDNNDRKAAAAIAAERRGDVLEVVSGRYIRTISALERRVEELRRAVTAAANREDRLQSGLAEARAREAEQAQRAEQFSEQILDLQKDLAHEREYRAVDRSHMSDDYEILRTRMIRTVGGEVTLLTDGLHALRNGAPEVADEFLDRSLTALTREVQELRAAGDPE